MTRMNDGRTMGGLRRAGVALALAGAACTLGGCIMVVGGKGHHEWAYDDGYHEHRRPKIGVHIGEVSDSLASQLAIRGHRATLITRVLDGRPADEAGIRRYDVVVAIDGEPFASPRALRQAIETTDAGEALELTLLREGAELVVSVYPERR